MFKLLFIMSLSLWLAGCARKDVDLNNNFWQNKPEHIIIVVHQAPIPQYYDENNEEDDDFSSDDNTPVVNFLGTADARKLNKYLRTLDVNWYYNTLPQRFQQLLAKEHIASSIEPTHPKTSGIILNGSPLLRIKPVAGMQPDDKILTLELIGYGARSRSVGPLHTVPMEGYCNLIAELSDPRTKVVYWRHTITMAEPSAKPWRQAPNFPNLTHAILTAQDNAQTEMIDSFLSGR